jgi:hypothetical protein
VEDAQEGIDEVRRNVRRIMRPSPDEEGHHSLSEWISTATPDFDHIVQNAVERVFKLLDLPRRSDVEALNRNLERVADAVERLEAMRRAEHPQGDDATPASEPTGES